MIPINKDIFKYVCYAFLFCMFLLMIFVFSGCGKTIIKRNYTQPPVCDTQDRLIEMASKMTGIVSKQNTSVAVALNLVTLSFNKCEDKREQEKTDKKRSDCIKMVYGDKLLPKKENYKKYADFADCTGIK